MSSGAFTHNHFYTQPLLRHTNTFTHKHFYTQTSLHTGPFAHDNFYAETLLTHRRLYTQTLLRTNTLNADAFTHKHFYTQALAHADPLPGPNKLEKNPQLWTLKHHFVRKGCRRTNPTEKPSFFDTRTSFRAKGLPPDKPKSQKTLSF